MAKMVETIATVNSVVRTLLILILLFFLSTVAWFAYSAYYEQEMALAASKADLEQAHQRIGQMQRQIDQLSLRLKLLKVDRRVARLVVLRQEEPQEAGGRMKTTFQFAELGEGGQPLGDPQTFTVEGDMIFINYKVVKFEDELVETEDPLRSASIALIQRIYGEHQAPADGFVIDREGERPQAYRVAEEPSEYEQKLWDNFWEIANDLDKAAEYGVRAAHEESPGMKVQPGKKYELEIRSSGGLSIRPLPEEAEI